MTFCEFDGSTRIPVIAEPGYTLWKCPWCKQYAEERHEPDPLQVSFERREHPQ